MMPPSVTIRAPEGPIKARITLPASKSVANRALVLASLAGDLHGVKGFGTADDTRILHDLLERRPATMHCGDGGTTLRFLLAWACVQEGATHVLTGSTRLLQRPHRPLVEALRSLGAEITETADGYRVEGRKMAGGAITLHAPESSQYVSALLLVAARFTNGLQLTWTGTRLSEPYVRMTLELCRRAGVAIEAQEGAYRVEPGALKPLAITIPGDWSAAAFWYQIAALSAGSRIRLNGLASDGLQGDEALVELLSGVVDTAIDDDGLLLSPPRDRDASFFTADLTPTPDLFQPLALGLAALGRSARFTGLHNLSLKETDRLKAVGDALHALGCSAHQEGDTFRLEGPVTVSSPPPLDPRGDHRMAMALAPMALVCDQITIQHPDVVNKSYPDYWSDLERAGFRLEFR